MFVYVSVCVFVSVFVRVCVRESENESNRPAIFQVMTDSPINPDSRLHTFVPEDNLFSSISKFLCVLSRSLEMIVHYIMTMFRLVPNIVFTVRTEFPSVRGTNPP